jgi:hypothetical protein
MPEQNHSEKKFFHFCFPPTCLLDLDHEACARDGPFANVERNDVACASNSQKQPNKHLEKNYKRKKQKRQKQKEEQMSFVSFQEPVNKHRRFLGQNDNAAHFAETCSTRQPSKKRKKERKKLCE